MTLIYIFFGIIIVGIMIWVIWRISSQRQSLPCPSWLHILVEMDNPFTEINHAEVIIQQLNLKPGMKVLDAGCGPGRLTIPLAKMVGEQGEVTAMDIQEGMLDRVRAKAQAANLQNIHFLNAGLGENNLPSCQYDRVLLVTVLGEIPDQTSAMKEIYNAIKPGGVLSITEIIFDPHFQSCSKVEQLALAAGFQRKDFFGQKLAYNFHFTKPT